MGLQQLVLRQTAPSTLVNKARVGLFVLTHKIRPCVRGYNTGYGSEGRYESDGPGGKAAQEALQHWHWDKGDLSQMLEPLGCPSAAYGQARLDVR